MKNQNRKIIIADSAFEDNLGLIDGGALFIQDMEVLISNSIF